MALQFQNVPIVFQGLNRKVDDRQGVSGQLLTLQNGWMDKTGKIQKRYGYTQTDLNADDNFYNFEDVQALAEWRGALLAFSGSISNVTDVNFYVSERAVLPDRRGAYWPAKLSFYRALSNVDDSVSYLHSESNTYKYIFTPTKIYQFTKEMALIREYDTAADLSMIGGLYPNYFMFGADDGIYVMYGEYDFPVIGPFNTLLLYKLTETNGVLQQESQTLIEINFAGRVDAVMRKESGIDYIYLIYDGFSTNFTVTKYNTSTDTFISYSVAVSPQRYSIDVHSGYVFYGYDDGLFTYYGVLNSDDLTVKRAATTVPRPAGGLSVETFVVSGVVFDDDDVAASAWISYDNNETMSVRQDRISSTRIQNSQVVSRAFSSNFLGTKETAESNYGKNLALAWIRVEPDAADVTNNVFMCIDAGRDEDLNYVKTYAHCLNARSRALPDVDFRFSEKLLFYVSEITDSIIVADVNENTQSVDFEYSRLLLTDTGPNLAHYDGKYFMDAGFAYYPTVSFDSYTGGGTLNGTYYYRVLASYKDAQGNIHRSAPSLPVETTPANQNVLLAIPPFYGFFAGRETKVEVYRSDDGSLYRKIGNSLDATAVTGFIDNDTRTLGEALYTTGGILEHIAPPATRSAWASKDRVWIISAEDPLQVFYSKRLVPFEGPNFTDAFVLQVEDQGGELFAGASLDDKTVLFKKTAIYVVFGEGPDELGSGEYAIQQISYDTGTTNPRSVLETNQGIYFASQKGIYLLTKDLQTQFIGAPVDDYDQSLITQSIVLEDRNQVWFFRSNGETMVFDTYHGQWATFTSQPATGAAIVEGTVRYVVPGSTSASFYEESTSTYQDGTTNYDVVLESNWFQLSGLQGYQRCRLMQLAGKVTGSYDYNLVMQYDVGDATTSETFSDTATTENKHEFKPKVQKTEAFKFTLTLSGQNRGFDITNFNLNVGSKGGNTRLPESNRKVGA